MSFDHTTIVEDDIERLADVERLTLWNVKVPSGFFSRLTRLWWVDWRGGSKAQQVEQIRECRKLRFLRLNQIRGLDDLEFLIELRNLELLSIYGLSAVESLPSFAELSSLRRFELGQMKRLDAISPALDAPNLQELLLLNMVKVTAEDVCAIKSHKRLQYFDWSVEGGVADRVWFPVRQAIALPPTRLMHPEEWFF